MKLYIKNKILSWGGGSQVVDEQNNPVYVVKGKVLVQHEKREFAI